MSAIAKMRAFGIERLSEKTGRDKSILYRWITALETGDGIKDRNKLQLIAATADSEHAIVWADFYPRRVAA